jgi:hypothetical protein
VSQYFRAGGRAGDHILWNPSNGVAQIFVGQLRAIERVQGLDAGVSDTTYDEYHIDVAALATFTQALSDTRTSSNNTVLRLELSGVSTICAPVLLRADALTSWMPDQLVEEARDLIARMPT